MAAEFRLEGDDGVGSVGGPSVMGAGDTIQLEDPDFMIADDGEIIQLPPRRKMPSTPARTAGAKMSSDAGASARVRKEHEDGQQAGDQVSFATFLTSFCTAISAICLTVRLSSLTRRSGHGIALTHLYRSSPISRSLSAPSISACWLYPSVVLFAPSVLLPFILNTSRISCRRLSE